MTGEACAPIVCIQDLGSEPAYEAVYMGVRREPLRQLIEARGDHDDMLTMATSNINIFGQDFEHRYGDRVVGAQGLAQKNTVLAVWMAWTYFDPVSSVAPAAYIAWQNIINSIQLYLHGRHATHAHNSHHSYHSHLS